MPNNIIQEINRTAMAIVATSEICFSAIEMPKQNLDIEIYSLTFGCLLTTAADKSAFISQYAVILRNANIDNNYTATPLTPNTFPSGSDILWFGNASDVSAPCHIDFGDEPLILQAGNKYLAYVCQPAFNGARTGTIYPHISLNARVPNYQNQDVKWRVR